MPTPTENIVLNGYFAKIHGLIRICPCNLAGFCQHHFLAFGIAGFPKESGKKCPWQPAIAITSEKWDFDRFLIVFWAVGSNSGLSVSACTDFPKNYFPIIQSENMFCQKCGKENPDGTAFCNSCVAALNQVPGQQASSKHNEIIKAKIKTKEDEKSGPVSSGYGPLLLGIIGVVFFFLNLGVLGVIVGILIIGFAYCWYSDRDTKYTKLQNEIKELEVELN